MNTPTYTNWSAWGKIFFRFFFLFLSMLSLIAYNPLMQVLGMGYFQQRAFFGNLNGVVTWLDGHIFHLGYLPAKHSIDFSDTHFGVIIALTILAIALVFTIVWTLLAKTKTNYNRLYYWFSNYLAYYIFLAMLPYAIEKIIPVQATYPTAPELLSRWGDLRRWEVLFRFMGTSPLYCMFCGWLEFTASVLILFNRTRITGSLLMVIALVQVVCLNIFYNNNIILLSGILLLADLFIIATALPKLYIIFIQQKPVSLARYRYTFHTPWKKYAMIALCFLPVWRLVSITTSSWKYYNRFARNQQKQRLYNVAVFIQGNDTIPPLTTDTTRWKYVCFLDFSLKNKQMVKYNMQEKTVNYQCKWDSIGHKVTFIDPNDTSKTGIFYFKKYANDNLELKGALLGKNMTMQLTNAPIDSMTLVKDKFLFMQEDQ